ncbi:MAG: molybdenum ABC transporter ATP-binding protein, partial [Gemmatimonadetes bacterium]|nr:molybdenum ABC transporter ATP-binding protein [Gemmatimonadota bacterium]
MKARLELSLASFSLDAAFEAPARGVTGVLGPSGSGKTTLLRCVGGLERQVSGRFQIGERIWLDSERGICVPAHRRPLGFVFQHANLFTHLSVRANLLYGARRVPKRRRRFELRTVVEWLGLEKLLHRHPSRLSGGEQQRVAIGRALLRSPELLLLDEPLASLDQRARRAILPYLERLHADLEIPVLYVSHSMSEIARLADHVIWLESGRIRETGSPQQVLSRHDLAEATHDDPRSVIEATVSRHDHEYHLSELTSPLGPLYVGGLDHVLGEPVRVQIHASDVSLALEAEARHSILNVFRLDIVELREFGPGQMLVYLSLGQGGEPILVARITRKSAHRLKLKPGKR